MNERKLPKMWKHVAVGVALIAFCAGPAYAQVVPGQYIVVLNNNVGNPAAVAQQLTAAQGAQLGFVYEHALKGFSFAGPAAAAGAIAQNPLVAFVEPDQVVHAHCHQGDPQVIPTGIQRVFADGNSNITIDGNDDLRIDVDIAIIDTGIDLTHFDLNVVASTKCSGGSPFNQSCTDGEGNDDNGHGSHVAGSAAAIDNANGVVGVAPGARLYAVKVLNQNGSGQIAWVIAGIDWVTAFNTDADPTNDIEVANMSLGCACTSSAMDTAISNSVEAGVTYAVSAGNSNADAAGFSPANHPDVITVSALADFDGLPGGLASPTCREDVDDTLADFSNWGSLIEVTAPGVCILSLWKDGMCATISGTSMSSPHVAGAAALLAASPINPNTPENIRNILISTGNFNWIDDLSGPDEEGDGILEPLLDVSDSTVFAPATVAGTAGCTTDPDCDDALACNGAETCVDGSCQAGTPIDCDDLVPCTVDTCNEPGGSCSNVADDGLCDDGLFCNGAETCDPVFDCQAGTDPCAPSDVCLEDSDTCCTPSTEICNDTVDNDCDGLIDCDDADCSGDPACACAATGEPCTDDADCCSNKCRGKPGAKKCKSD